MHRFSRAFSAAAVAVDDVIDRVGDVRMTSTDSLDASNNDLPFLRGFPFLANPHPAR